MKLVDLGACEITGSCALGNARAAWTHWRNANQWHIALNAQSAQLVEGQPDRLPYPEEPIADWLKGRSGSFRGFEITWEKNRTATVRAFTDPLATRPVYYLISNGRLCIADKLSTVVLNSEGEIEPDWGGLLESAILGSLYSYKTTVRNAVWLEPGESIEFEGTRIVGRERHTLPLDPSLTKSEVTSHPAETLHFALEKSVAETWIDPEMRLLLSGGLDSRIILALASGKRKTLTVGLYPAETEITKQVAAAAGSELQTVATPDYEYPMRLAYLVTGAMHESRFTSHLGLVTDWRRQGIPGITHAYFHNTIYRGWTAAPYDPRPICASVLYDLMGRNAYYFERYGCKHGAFQRDLFELLSEDGKAVLRAQLQALSASLIPSVVDGYDITFEKRLLGFVSRQTYFTCMLAWYEALDVASPVFHPTLWTWYALSSPRHRARDWAIRELYLTLDRPIAKVPDSNTGQPIAHLKVPWQDHFRSQFWYPAFRRAYLKMFWKPLPLDHGGMQWGDRFRNPAILSVLEDGVSVLRENPLFDQARLRAAMDAYRGGAIDWVDSICALAAVGQWQDFVSNRTAQTGQVRAVQLQAPVLSNQKLAPSIGAS